MIVLAGDILRAAQPFLKQNTHPTVIIRSYRQALEEDIINVLRDDIIAIPIDLNNREQVRDVIKAYIGTKFISKWSDLALDIAEDAVKTVFGREWPEGY